MGLNNLPMRRKHRGKKMTASEAIQACNILIWKCMFPPDQGFCIPFGSHQHKSLILSFMGGVMAADASVKRMPSMDMIDLYNDLCDPDWQPDDRFRPTSHANN